MGKGKKFIDKKKSVTYRLVPAESGSSENVPKYTFVPVSKGNKKLSSFFPSAMCPSAPHVTTQSECLSEGVGADLDPDVIRGLDDDFDYEKEENILDDDFIVKANACLMGNEKTKKCDFYDEDDNSSSDISSNFSDEDGPFNVVSRQYFEKPEGKEYSMTSAMTNCSETIKVFNEKFEKVLDLYDDDEIGALDFEDIDGHLSPGSIQVKGLNSTPKDEEVLVLGHYDDALKQKILGYAEVEKPETFVNIITERPIEFDCESILSTCSTAYNHPTLIKSEHRPAAKSHRQKLTKSHLKQLEKETTDTSDEESFENRSVATIRNMRPKNETPEERRQRKKVVKEARKENRAIKKENKKAFTLEKRRQEAREINARRNAGMKIL